MVLVNYGKEDYGKLYLKLKYSSISKSNITVYHELCI